MGENAILELRTVNVQKDFGSRVDPEIPKGPVFLALEKELTKVDAQLMELLSQAGFVFVKPGVFKHPDGSEIIGNRHMDFQCPEWASAYYRGYGNRDTVAPVIQEMKTVYGTSGVRTTLTTF
jgi:hypothetical protein